MGIIAVKGTNDIYNEQAEGINYIEELFSAVCNLYGYRRMDTPILEYTEVFDRSSGDSSDVVRKEMYTFLDKGNRSVTMRPEFTAGIARCINEHKLYATEELPIKAFYYGPAFRYERPQLGRYRQFLQAGVECVGVDSARFDAETICLAVSFLQMLGFEQVKIKINSLGDEASRKAYREALTSYFSAHIDSMCEDCHERIKLNPLRILDCKVPHDHELAEGAPKMKDYLTPESEKRFYQTLSILADNGVDYEVDDSLVRGLDYYSEVVFEVSVLSSAGQDYGAVMGGGHYDGLLSALGGPQMAGVGFAFGLERLYLLMKDKGLLGEPEGLDIYLMPVGEGVLDEAFALAQVVRSLGFSCFLPDKSGKLGSQFKKAERRKAKFALILGEEELSRGVAQLKNMKTQVQKEINLEDIEDELDEAFGESQHHHHEE